MTGHNFSSKREAIFKTIASTKTPEIIRATVTDISLYRLSISISLAKQTAPIVSPNANDAKNSFQIITKISLNCTSSSANALMTVTDA